MPVDQLPRLQGATATVGDIVVAVEADGYCIVEGLLAAPELATIKQSVSEILASTPTGRNDFEGFVTQRVYGLFAKTRAFDELAVHPLVLGILDHFLERYQLCAPTAISIGPGEVAQPLHRDDGIYPLGTDFAAEVIVNTMWALDEFTEANGATRVIPGSHRWTGDWPDPMPDSIPAVMPAGSAMFYLGRVVHGGGANTSDRPRVGTILEYVASWLRPQENHHLLVVPRDVVAQLSTPLQELLGYNMWSPVLGHVDGRHPRKLLERTAS